VPQLDVESARLRNGFLTRNAFSNCRKGSVCMRKAEFRDGMTRAEYEGRAANRRASAQRLRSKGMTVKAIADRLGVSDERVRQLLLEAEPHG
jgi:hypothetical protein